MLALSAGSALAELSTNSPLRMVSDGVGNCIFSTGSLPSQAPDRIREVRCHQPKRTQDYKAQGVVYNQLRDDNVWHNYVTVESISGKITAFEQLKVWDPDGKCNIKDRSDLGTNGCLDVEKQVRALAKRDGGALPYTGKVCVSLYFKWTDTYNEVLSPGGLVVSRERTRVEPQYMAIGEPVG